MPTLPRDDDSDELEPETPIGDHVVEATGPTEIVTFEIIDMVALFGTDYAVGYEVLDGEYGDELQAHRHLGRGRGFQRVTDEDLIDRLASMSVLATAEVAAIGEETDEDAAPPDDAEGLTYAIVDTVAVAGHTWTLGRALADHDAAPDVFRYDGHGHSFSLVADLDPALRARIEDEIRGMEQDDFTYEKIDFDLRQMVDFEGHTYAIGYREDEDAPRVWRHLGEGLGFELIERDAPVHAQVVLQFPGLFDDEDRAGRL